MLFRSNQGLLVKVEEYTHNIGTSERTGAVVEPRISTQWFMDMQKFMKKNPEVLSSVMGSEERRVGKEGRSRGSPET